MLSNPLYPTQSLQFVLWSILYRNLLLYSTKLFITMTDVPTLRSTELSLHISVIIWYFILLWLTYLSPRFYLIFYLPFYPRSTMSFANNVYHGTSRYIFTVCHPINKVNKQDFCKKKWIDRRSNMDPCCNTTTAENLGIILHPLLYNLWRKDWRFLFLQWPPN